MFKDTEIAFIGTGNMAEAIIGGLIRNNLLKPHQIIGYDISESRLDEMKSRYDIQTTMISDSVVDLSADIVVLAVKPQIFPKIKIRWEGKHQWAGNHPVALSIMAGVTIDQIRTQLKQKLVVRSMPNTPSLVGEGMTVWTATEAVSEEQKTQADAIFGAVGKALFVNDEKYIDMATAMNGSGPAYVFLMMEAMIDAGVQMGLTRPDSELLVKQTFAGATTYAKASDQPISTLRNAVTSPGGTTAAALYTMEKAGLRTAIVDGVLAAHNRAIELGELESKS